MFLWQGILILLLFFSDTITLDYLEQQAQVLISDKKIC